MGHFEIKKGLCTYPTRSVRDGQAGELVRLFICDGGLVSDSWLRSFFVFRVHGPYKAVEISNERRREIASILQRVLEGGVVGGFLVNMDDKLGYSV
jgi:hypothetical protein